MTTIVDQVIEATVDTVKVGKSTPESNVDFYGAEKAQELVQFDFAAWLASKGLKSDSRLRSEKESTMKVLASQQFALPRNVKSNNAGLTEI